MDPRPAPFPVQLTSPGATDAAFEQVLDAADLPEGAMRRVTRGDRPEPAGGSRDDWR